MFVDTSQGPPVATLMIKLDDECHEHAKTRSIYPGDSFDIGRDDITGLFGSVIKTISKHHFNIRCIVFDKDDATVSPMVYLRVLSANGLLLLNVQHGQAYTKLLSRSEGARLLNPGDILRLTKRISVEFDFIDQSSIPRVPGPTVQYTELECRKDVFRVTGHTIGSGAFARVTIAIRASDEVQLACKVVPIITDGSKRQGRWQNMIEREVQILKAADHPNIISVHKVLSTARNTYIMQELATGGDLLSYQQRMGVLAEPEVLCISFQLVQAVHYLHTAGIVHRDIKPENILLTSWQSGFRILLADFGQARYVRSPTSELMRMRSFAGTEGWQAPELKATILLPSTSGSSYSNAVDMWSLGSVVFACLTGNRPDEDHAKQDGARQHELAILLRQATTTISKKAISFIQECLVIDEVHRLTAKAAILHSWFTCTHYRSELLLAYERAISSWKPRTSSDEVIERCEEKSAWPMTLSQDQTLLVPPRCTSIPRTQHASIDFVPPRSTQM